MITEMLQSLRKSKGNSSMTEVLFASKIPTALPDSSKIQEALRMVRSGELQIGGDTEEAGIFNSEEVKSWEFGKEGALERVRAGLEAKTGLKEIPPALLKFLRVIHQQALKKPSSTVAASVARMISSDEDIKRAYNQKALAAVCSN